MGRIPQKARDKEHRCQPQSNGSGRDGPPACGGSDQAVVAEKDGEHKDVTAGNLDDSGQSGQNGNECRQLEYLNDRELRKPVRAAI